MNDNWQLIKNEEEFKKYKDSIFQNWHIKSIPKEYPCFVFDYMMPDESPEIEIIYAEDLRNMNGAINYIAEVDKIRGTAA